MSTFESLSHSRWDCKISYGALYGKIRKFLGPVVLHELAEQRRSVILEEHMMQDHVPMLLRISPKYSVAEVIGYIRVGAQGDVPARRVWQCGVDRVDDAMETQRAVFLDGALGLEEEDFVEVQGRVWEAHLIGAAGSVLLGGVGE